MGLSDKTKTRRRFRAQKLILLEHGRCNQAYLDLILQTRFHLVLLVPPWIKVKLGNGETTYFWSSNWSPYGRIRDYTHSESSTSLGIASNSTLAELWEMDHWILPGTRRFGSQVGFLSINF